jgi:hypothetical protein
MKLEEEPPMFSKLKINIPLRTTVTKLIANNDVMLVALANNSVLRVDMRTPDKIEGVYEHNNFCYTVGYVNNWLIACTYIHT